MLQSLTRIIAVLFFIGLLLPACGRDDPPSPLLDDLPGEFGYHLQYSDDATLREYVNDIGRVETSFTLLELRRRRGRMSPEEHALRDEEMLYYTGRLSRVLASEFCMNSELLAWEFYGDLPRESRYEYSREIESQQVDFRSTALTAGERIAKAHEYIALYETLGDETRAAKCRLYLASFYLAAGDDPEHERYLRMCLEYFERIGDTRLLCQVLGTLGAIYRSRGNVDSMRVYYDGARGLALGCRLGEQAARIESFYASYYQDQGRLALSIEYLDRALDTAYELNAGIAQDRYLMQAMQFYADLGAWRTVDRLMTRADLLTKRYPRTADYRKARLYFGPIRARLLLASGDLPGAERIWRELKPDMPAWHKGEYLRMLHHWAEGLLANGLRDDAMDVIGEGLRFSDATHVHDWHARLCLKLCEAHLVEGNTGAAQAALEQFAAAADSVSREFKTEQLERLVLQCRIDVARGQTDRAENTLLSLLDRLDCYVGQMDASTHGYLWINELRQVRRLVNEMTLQDPISGYGAQFYWRELYARLGTNGRKSPISGFVFARIAASPDVDVTARFNARAEPALQRLSELDATHLMYATAGDSVLRWIARDGDVRCEVLGMSTGELRGLAGEAWHVMQEQNAPEAPDRAVSDYLAGLLTELGSALLPRDLLSGPDGPDKPLLLVTTDDFLGRIPFEAIGLTSAATYTPLLAMYDLAYVRDLRPMKAGIALTSSLVVVDPTPANSLNPPPRLDDAEREADNAVESLDGGRVLSGENATKANLQAGWEDAAVLHFATHVVRDPEVSFIAYIQLAPDEEAAGREATQLDIIDIRAADLSGCALVVLAGCSSGVPYLDASNSGPSLADAFLDAGAAAVVQTFCDIDDKEATEFMKLFTSGLTGTTSTVSTIRALARERRDAMTGPNGIRHPFRWTSYAIKISGI